MTAAGLVQWQPDPVGQQETLKPPVPPEAGLPCSALPLLLGFGERTPAWRIWHQHPAQDRQNVFR